MKVPFSYRSQFFSPLLLTSLVGHWVSLGAGGAFLPGPQFSVERAPSSVEVVLVKKPEIRRQKKTERILTVDTSSITASHETQKKEEKKSAQDKISPGRGSLTEAYADSFRNPAPSYPVLAREQGWQGGVILEVWVDEKGQVSSIQVAQSSGYKILDGSALKTVKNWRFSPARLGHFSVSSRIKIPVRFILTEKNE